MKRNPVRQQVHWRQMKASEEDDTRSSKNNLGVVIMKKICLRAALMRMFLKVKPMEKRIRANGMVHGKSMAKANMKACANLPNRAQPVRAVLKISIPLQSRCVTNPERRTLLWDVFTIHDQQLVNVQ